MGHFVPRTVTKSSGKPHKSGGSQQCTSRKVQCPDCGKVVKDKNLNSHQRKKCPKRFARIAAERKAETVRAATRTPVRQPVRETVSSAPSRAWYERW
ncbi:MAG: hypothetical protein PHI23_04655 [Candidatus Peribacteraceae bacterium]|nr:hypothetical protein [Candidatus Peribacteraceae bacterium]